MKIRYDHAGKRFGKLVAIDSFKKGRWWFWRCRCDCGSEANITACRLIAGKTRSCGCLHRRSAGHGARKTPTYQSWCNLRSRCNDPGSLAYPRYGGRGISVCERWESFANFLADMGEKPIGFTLDRIDNNKGYSPENCRWATPIEQNRNRSTVTLNQVSVDLVRYMVKRRAHVSDLSHAFGVTERTVYDVVSRRSWK